LTYLFIAHNLSVVSTSPTVAVMYLGRCGVDRRMSYSRTRCTPTLGPDVAIPSQTRTSSVNG